MNGFFKKLIRSRLSTLPSVTTATIHPSATLLKEGVIENNLRKPEAIYIDAHTVVKGRLLTFGHAGNIHIGQWCYIGERSEIWSACSVSIGDRVLISHNVNIIDTNSHADDPRARHLHFQRIMETGHLRNPEDMKEVPAEPIVIEDDCWISFNVSILKGVRIGKGSIIGAGAIVTHDIPPYSLYYCEVKPIIKSLLTKHEQAEIKSRE